MVEKLLQESVEISEIAALKTDMGMNRENFLQSAPLTDGSRLK